MTTATTGAAAALAADRRPKLVVAIDTADPARVATLAARVAPHCAALKLGLEFFCAAGPDGVRPLGPVFLDLKLHDIPNTVAGAVSAVLPLRPRHLTLHAAGGAAMIAAAREAAEEAGAARPLLLAVTVLTSLDAAALQATGVSGGPRQLVMRLARLAREAGADGIVCGPQEVAPLRDIFGADILLATPGIRPRGHGPDDQARTMTPREAADAGADLVIVGRPITRAADPAAAAAAIAAELA